MKRNGTTSKGTTRWRCKQCGASSVKRRNDITNAAVFTQFIEHCTTAISLDDLAKRNGVSRATMKRRFKWCWLVDVPDPTAGHHKRIYDQVFLDGTYTAGGCLIVAATIDHVIAWHWCKHETTRDYQLLLERIEAPLIAVIDGGQGAYSAIKKCWPTTKIQRCLVHAQRVVRRYTTTNPRTDAGRTIYRLALKLTRITTLDEAAAWGVQLHEFSTIYREWMNEKTMIKDPKTGAWTRVWTHHNVRKAYNSLNHLWRSEMLFVYLNPPAGVLAPERIKSTTNSLEGGINAQLKLLARTHRGRSGERQRRMLDWWLYLKTELPDDPVRIARQSDWGQGQLAKVSTLTQTANQADHETGRPALYDNAICQVPGFVEACLGRFLSCCCVLVFCLLWCDVAQGEVGVAGVVPVDPGGGFAFDLAALGPGLVAPPGPGLVAPFGPGLVALRRWRGRRAPRRPPRPGAPRGPRRSRKASSGAAPTRCSSSRPRTPSRPADATNRACPPA